LQTRLQPGRETYHSKERTDQLIVVMTDKQQ